MSVPVTCLDAYFTSLKPVSLNRHISRAEVCLSLLGLAFTTIPRLRGGMNLQFHATHSFVNASVLENKFCLQDGSNLFHHFPAHRLQVTCAALKSLS